MSGKIRYTVNHEETHESLFMGQMNSKDKTLAILQSRSTAVVEGEQVEFVPSQWYVTAYDLEQRDADDDPEIMHQVNASEFLDHPDEF